MCIVALCFTLLNISVRIINAGFGPFTQVYLRIALGLLLTIGLFYKKIDFKKFGKISRKDWILLVLMGTLGYGLAVDFVTLGVLHTKLLNVAVMSSTTPLFVFLFTILVLRKAFKLNLLLFLLITIYGVFVLATKSLIPSLSQFNSGDFFVLLYAAGIGIYVLGRKFLSNKLNNTEIAVVVLFFAFICSVITAFFIGESLPVSGFLNSIALYGLLVSGFIIVLVTKLQNFGFQKLNAVVATQLLLVSNLFSLILGYLLYGESISYVEFFGAWLVVIGVWLYSRYSED